MWSPHRRRFLLTHSMIRRLLGYTSYVCVRMQRNGIVKDLSGVAGNFTDLNKMAGLYFSGWTNSDMLENQMNAGNGVEVNSNLM